MSSGNVWTEIDLGNHKTTLIVGTNGAGKSTMLDAIVFGLYGKPFRKINKGQLINSVNQKGLLVEVEFSIGKDNYMISRGVKPNLFEIRKNDELIDQDASSKDYQTYLEENILKLNFKSFSQIVILGSATYVPFMQLTAQNRREVIEDLLDIQIFSTMNTLLKEKVSSNKTEMQETKYQIDLIESKIQSAKDNNQSIKKIKETQLSDIKEKVRNQLETIASENGCIEQKQSDILALTDTIQDKSKVRAKQDKLKNLKHDLQTKMNALSKDILFYDSHDNCPVCRQGIAHEFKENTVSDNKKKMEEIEAGLGQLDLKMKEVDGRLNEISDVEDQIQKLNIQIGEHRGNVNMSKSTLNSYKKEMENAEKEVKEVDESKIREYTDELRGTLDMQKSLYDDKETLSIVATMLKDGGIKTKIIKQYIPIMNRLINKYLAEFDLFVDFQLDESFNEKIKSRFRDEFSYMSFSEGEKMRINLAILLTWRAVSKIRNSMSTNLLIFDEIFDGALDTDGVENLIQVLNNLTEGDNIFVISHKGDVMADKFDHTIKFEKVKNFSVIA